MEEFEIPFVEPFVDEIDYEAKEIHLDLPEGLLGELEHEESVKESDQGSDDEVDDEAGDEANDDANSGKGMGE